MPNSPSLIRVLTVTKNDLMLELIQTALEREPDEYQHLDGSAATTLPDILETIEQTGATYLLLDYLLQGIQVDDVIDDITLRFPEIVVIVILPEDRSTEANKLVLAGARAFIIQPFNQNQLLSVLGRMKELQARLQQTKSSGSASDLAVHHGTLVVFSPKGGVGCSSVAINLAAALTDVLKQELLLVDGKLLFGDIDIMLNLKTHNSISDLIPHAGSLDETLIRDVVSEHVSGVKVLPAPSNATAAHGIRPEELHLTISALQSVFSHIVIDGGNFLNENVVTFMDASQKIILVLSPDIACLRDASRFFELCRTTLSFPKDKILVVVNQFDSREGLSISDIERALQVKVFATLPWDRHASLQGINGGVPVVLQGHNSALRKAFNALAKDLASVVGHTPGDVRSRKPLPDVLAKSSRLG
jgi:pilus assembly protein CpaE